MNKLITFSISLFKILENITIVFFALTRDYKIIINNNFGNE